MKKYFRTKIELGVALREAIDDYWEREEDDEEFFDSVVEVIRNNEELFYRDGDYSSTIRHRLGARRLELLEKIIKEKKEGIER